MSYKSENWKEKLEQVRNHIALKEGSVEKTADEILESQIEEELANSFIEEEVQEGKVLKFTKVKDKSLEKHLKVVTKKVGAKLEKISGGFAVSDTDMRGFTAVVDYIMDKSIKKEPFFLANPTFGVKLDEGKKDKKEEVEEKQSVEKTTEKLVERNMLGRLAKQLKLNEEGKQKMFAYFEKGELQQ